MEWKHFPAVSGAPWFTRSRSGLLRIAVDEVMALHGVPGAPARTTHGTLSILNNDGDWKTVGTARGPVFKLTGSPTKEDSEAQVLLTLKALADYVEGS
jgi:hypothetical protein